MAKHGPEVRLGLVLYGGVSLAVYIYGVVIEVQRLLRASEELERGGDVDRMSSYARALDAAGASRATVDILSGTSAGGINGVLLAKALARGADVEAAKELWLEGGDIEQLLQPPSVVDPHSLLRSDHFQEKLLEGMKLLDKSSPKAPTAPPILDLFVSATHLSGEEKLFVDALGSKIATRQHRYVFQLKLRRFQPGPEGTSGKQGYKTDDFRDNTRLATLARATSAFPFAFEPVELTAADKGMEEEKTAGWFADGGILNNKPFTEAVDTIAARRSDRPVRRWLLSVDPDPEAAEEAEDAPPAFDQTVVRSIASIPRYQSIVRDLLALEEHNEKVAAAEVTIIESEIQLMATAVDSDAGDGGTVLEPGIEAGYRVMRAQARGLELAGGLMTAVDRAGISEGLDTAGVHRAFRKAGETESGDLDTDIAYHRRRVYYLIKLCGMAAAESVAVNDAKAALWAEYEELSGAAWNQLSRRPLKLDPENQARSAQARARQRIDAGAGALADAIERSENRLRSALKDVEVVAGRAPADAPSKRDPEVTIPLLQAFDQFERRDAILLSADVYGGLRQRDRIEHAQISPVAANNTGVPPMGRLAGATLGHFGGFLDRGWRRSDLMWGRLDAAEILIGVVLAGQGNEQREELMDKAQLEVVEAEKPDLVEHSGDWKSGLLEHAKGDRDEGQVNGRRLLSLGLQATTVVRKMLRTAAADSNEKGFFNRARVIALRTAANLLGYLLALIYLPTTAFFTEGKYLRRALIAVFFLPFLWGLATIALALFGPAETDDVLGPAGVAIAAYPAFVFVYWCAWILARKLKRAARVTRRPTTLRRNSP